MPSPYVTLLFKYSLKKLLNTPPHPPKLIKKNQPNNLPIWTQYNYVVNDHIHSWTNHTQWHLLQETTKRKTDDFNLKMNKNDVPDTSANLPSIYHSCSYDAKSGKPSFQASHTTFLRPMCLWLPAEQVHSPYRFWLNGKTSAALTGAPTFQNHLRCW